MQADGRSRGFNPRSTLPPLCPYFAHQVADIACLRSFGQLQAHLLGTDWQNLSERPFQHHRIREIHEMDCYRGLLFPKRHVEYAGPLDLERLLLIPGPADGVGQDDSMILAHYFPERPIDLAGEVDDPPGAYRTHNDPGN